VTNVAARLCARAADGQILVTQRVVSGTEGVAVCDPVGDLELPGLARPVRAFNIKGLHPPHVIS
jgi:class 3 adenylate cyclase